MKWYVVFDEKGIIHESTNEDEAMQEFKQTKNFQGDIIMAEILCRRK